MYLQEPAFNAKILTVIRHFLTRFSEIESIVRFSAPNQFTIMPILLFLLGLLVLLAAGALFSHLRIERVSDKQALFISIVENARMTFDATENQITKDRIRPARAKNLCTNFTRTEINEWFGEAKKISTNYDGDATLSVAVGPSIDFVATSHSSTLIDKRSQLFADLSKIEIGQRVMFNGWLTISPEDCFKELSWTTTGSIEEPEFLFQFSSIKKY